MAKLKNMASTLTPPPAPRVGILGSTSGLKAPNQDSSKLIRPPSSSQALSSKSLALGGQEGQEIQLGGQNSEFRPLKIFEQQQGLNDTHQNDHGNYLRPEHDRQHLGVFQNLLDGKLFSGLEEQREGFVLTQEEHDFRPERSQNIENPPMSQDQHILSSQGLSQVFEELPYSDSVLSSEQIMEASQEQSNPAISHETRSEFHVTPIQEQEERHEEEEISDFPGLDNDSFVIRDPPPPSVHEGLFGIVRTAKMNYNQRPTPGLKVVESHPHWICGAHQKRALFTWLMQKCHSGKKS